MSYEKNNSIIELLFYLSCVSIFFINTSIYPVVFLVFIIVTNIYNFRSSIFSKKEIWSLSILLFIIWSILISMFYGFHSNESFKVLIKIIINFGFIFTVINNSNKILSKNFNKRIIILLELLILLSFCQYCFLFFKLEIYKTIFEVSNSVNAYIITSRPELIFWGNFSKNLLASKVILIQVLYVIFIFSSKKINNLKTSVILGVSIFNAVISMGRTAQLAYFGVLFLVLLSFGYKYLKRFTNIKLIKYISYTIGITFVGLIIFKIPSLLRINLNINDGGYIRLIYWKTFITKIWNTNFIFGNGLLSTGDFLSKYSPYYIGESNMHNVLLNTLLDLGIIGTIIYLCFILGFFLSIYRKGITGFAVIIIIFVWISMTSLQYLGYDNDLIIFLSVLFLFASNRKNTQKIRY